MLSVVYVIYKSPVHYFTVSFKMVRLTKEQVQFYKDNGYIHLKNLIKGEELKRVSEEYDDLFKRKNQAKTESSWVGSDDTFRASDSPYTVRFFLSLRCIFKQGAPSVKTFHTQVLWERNLTLRVGLLGQTRE